jgi:transposase-like protein
MAAQGVDVSYETIRCWTIKFGPLIARRLKRLRSPPSPRWHLDEVVCWIENSLLPIRRRERQHQRFKSQASAQKFLTTHAAIYNPFNIQRHLISRPTLGHFRAEADAAWAAVLA